jgi:hypothetical protein
MLRTALADIIELAAIASFIVAAIIFASVIAGVK